MLHRQHVFGEQFPGVFTDDGYTENLVLARHGEHFDKAVGGLIGDGSVEVVDAVTGHFIGDVLRLGFAFGEADAGDFGVGKGAGGNHPVIHLKALET